MTKKDALNLRSRLRKLEFYKIDDANRLLELYEEIVNVINFIHPIIPPEANIGNASYHQLRESQGYLETSVKNNSNIRGDFNEYKSDFLSTLDDYIEIADNYDLWEPVQENL